MLVIQNTPETKPSKKLHTSSDTKLIDLIAASAEPLPSFGSEEFGKLFDRFGDKRVVLLGEASHGTSEFYQARAAISKYLIQHHGFNIIAVEADWPDAAAVDRHIRHRKSKMPSERPFQRFPTWMWRNTDFMEFIHWLHEYNNKISKQEDKVGFYGLDMYSMGESIAQVLEYLEKVDPDTAKAARERYGCLMHWVKEPSDYGAAVLRGFKKCEKKVIDQLHELLKKRLEYAENDGHSYFDAEMNARVIASAEKYYRIMYYGDADSWNLRDTHMFETLQSLLQTIPNGKAIIWAHNSHIGDARATEMGKERGELNIGQLCREMFGDEAAMIGFGTHTGTVTAADQWDSPAKTMKIRPSSDGSFEQIFHETKKSKFLLDLKKEKNVRQALMEPKLERFIGVIYRPNTERWSHYSECKLSEQFDAFVWFDETSAVTPIRPEHIKKGEPETYPFGL
uniref:Erythromycin esterase n=1 Tax=Panagrolaimus sp. PS1159 TaxID=55785 RepID=A0AC35FM85_9BILA